MKKTPIIYIKKNNLNIGDNVILECPFCGVFIDWIYDEFCETTGIKEFLCWNCNKRFIEDFITKKHYEK